MRLKTAKNLIAANKRRKKSPTNGYRISFEIRERGFLIGEFFPDRDEPPIKTKNAADDLAKEFAKLNKERYVNVHICHTDFSPVEGYDFYNKYSPARGYLK
jgi:hypothetical protein